MASFFQQNFYRRFLAISGAAFICILILFWFYESSILTRSDKIIDPELGITRNWNIGPVDHVFMTFENTLRYPLGVESGDDDWDASLPAGGGMIRLGKDKEEYSISMFHQLRCLAIIRNDINRVKGTDNPVPGKLTQHCMNYLRQMVLCRADLRLESARNPYGPRIAVSDVTHSCKDWKTVYRAAEDNYQGIK